MPILVQKFGGSSVADLDRLRKVARRVVETRRAGYDLVVVVSAMGDTTDELLAMARELAPSPSRRELDMLLSVGERISMTLLSMAIHQEGFEAISLTGSQCGIITTSSHSNARIIDVRPFRVQDELAEGRIVIVAGYQGTSYKREVTTLGRGGSDTTAVALAAALGAEACEIYSDVDGVFSADPRVVLDAQKLESLGHEEMLEMARAGAKVLNEQAVEFARKAKIALYARSTHEPRSRGTVIRPDGFEQRAALAERGRPAVAVSHIERGLWIMAEQSADAAFSLLDDVDMVVTEWTPGARLAAFLNVENLPEHDALIKSLEALGEDVRCDWRGCVSVVGQGIGGVARWVRLASEALAGTPPERISIHPARLSFVLPSDATRESARILHAALISHAEDEL